MIDAALRQRGPAVGPVAALPPRWVRLAFTIRRDGVEIGQERVDIERAGDLELVRSQTDAVVRLGPVTVYRFRHIATETWRDGRLEGLQARTEDNSVRHHLSIARAGRRLIIAADGRRRDAPLGTLPASLWTVRGVRQPQLLSTRDGRLLPVATERHVGVNVPGLGWLEGVRLTLDGGIARELWYDDAGLLRRLRFRARDGSDIIYDPMA